MEAELTRWATRHGLAVDSSTTPTLDGSGDSYAVFNADRTHRFALTRRWAAGGRTAVFVMLNPSTAKAAADDPTIRRCISAARRTGHQALLVLNLFSIISADPAVLVSDPQPAGPLTDDALTSLAHLGDTVIVAWGAGHSAIHNRADTVVQLLLDQRLELACLGTNRNGTPKHPVRLPESNPLIVYRLPARAEGGIA
ncbi:hypothetical protein RVR_P199 (plasmid) [Actinacidiphila reveromycinica]|uniref:DUF1643 domain-containing protein n=1 Tax=Actinacidiphila reveromycinica TaxID=659352 RepID=A0A7R6QDW6_9ACTN|nr:DUF1643 domain-containing protein [Streptomyces sp. SN-593]BBG20716.1 hypothetical protein RVR_P199 [Streptomyces sp. SN-593]